MNANILSTASKIAVLALLSIGTALAATTSTQTPATEPLLHSANLQYIGSFLVPQSNGMSNGTFVGSTFDFGGGALTYDSQNHSLFLIGDPPKRLGAEISIPTPVKSTSLSALPTASMIQPFADVLDGKIGQINPTDPNIKFIGGMLVDGSKLIVTAYSYYDGAVTQSSSHFVRPINLSTTGQVQGPFTVGSLYPGFVAGYMTWIPPAWQSLLGGPALTGNCCVPGATWESQGPAVSVFNPADLGVHNPVPATPLVGYPSAHALGAWDVQSTVFNDATLIGGVVFPQGTRSVLFFGRQGTGPFCYGVGTANPSLAGVPVPGTTTKYCYDPAKAGQKGTHAYPYVYQVWAYDANDLLSVKNGTLQQYQAKPYAIWTFQLPFEPTDQGHLIGGAAYDPSTNTIYLSENGAGPNHTPIIDAFHVSLILPSPPTNVIAK